MFGSTLISIITPLLNEEGYVKPFLDHLGDLEGNFELIFVDGGSSRRISPIEENSEEVKYE